MNKASFTIFSILVLFLTACGGDDFSYYVTIERLPAATAAGATAQLDTTAPYDGELLILVRNINTTGDTDVFDLTVSQP